MGTTPKNLLKTNTNRQGVFMSFFDYYQGSVNATPDSVIPAFVERFDFSAVDSAKATNGYERACLIHRGDNKLVTIQWGGNTGDMTQIKGTGQNAAQVAEIIRELYPHHRLQRADVAEDYSEPDIFKTLTDHAIYLAEHYKLKLDQRGDWVRGDPMGKGRTLYVGSRQSPAFLRLYEKGKEKAVRSGSECADPDHSRAEIEIKPQNKQQGFALSRLEPRDYWRVTPFLNEYSKILFTTDMERIRLHNVTKLSDDERAFQMMLKQYGNVMARLTMSNGSEWLSGTITDHVEKCISGIMEK